ncbi:LysR substrate-binding domain-containing protein [Castellaniella hirudinis]|uniref:LysR substrate-binding domain-containing protein n=1 Tax=Castellaniella hirudinis TaxID=1144617 RepID=UPI0039C32042
MSLLNELRVFIGLVHSGSFTATAANLGIPRPTATLAIQKLEKRLGARLFIRTTRQVRLTADGEVLFERARMFLDEADGLENIFQQQDAELLGPLRVDAPSRIARRLIAPALPDFHTRYPQLDILLSSSDRHIDLAREGLDCALRVGAPGPSNLTARHLGTLSMVNCASPRYLARFGVPASPADLGQHQVVRYQPMAPGEAAALWEWMDGPNHHTLNLGGPVAVNNVENYIACCLAGLGLIQIPAFDVQEHLDAGELVEVLPAWKAPPMNVQLVHPYGHYRPRRLQLFNDWLAGLLAPIVMD